MRKLDSDLLEKSMILRDHRKAAETTGCSEKNVFEKGGHTAVDDGKHAAGDFHRCVQEWMDERKRSENVIYDLCKHTVTDNAAADLKNGVYALRQRINLVVVGCCVMRLAGKYFCTSSIQEKYDYGGSRCASPVAEEQF